MGARLYDPKLARFATQDTVFGDLTNPSSLNQFGYGNGNPVTMSDPTGMSATSASAVYASLKEAYDDAWAAYRADMDAWRDYKADMVDYRQALYDYRIDLRAWMSRVTGQGEDPKANAHLRGTAPVAPTQPAFVAKPSVFSIARPTMAGAAVIAARTGPQVAAGPLGNTNGPVRGCKNAPRPQTYDALTGAACTPPGFAETMGYTPEVFYLEGGRRLGRPVDNDGGCNGPLGPAFVMECQVHDYGWDLARYFEMTRGKYGLSDRTEVDAFFANDLLTECDSRGFIIRYGCRVDAFLAWGGVNTAGYVKGPDKGNTPSVWSA